MPKKPNLVMKELPATEFGTILQEGKIVKMRAGVAVIEHTKKVRKKAVTNTYHVNLKPQLVHLEVEPEAEAPVKAAKPARKKPGRKPKAAPVESAEKAEKAPPKKRGRKPKAEKAAVDKPPKKTGGRKRRTKKAAPAEAAAEATPPAKPEAAPKKKKAPAKTKPASIPWTESLNDDDFEL